MSGVNPVIGWKKQSWSERTNLLYTIIFLCFICLYFSNQAILEIFCPYFKTTGYCIWLLHFCLSGKAKSAHGHRDYQPQQSTLCLWESDPIFQCTRPLLQVFLDQSRAVQKLWYPKCRTSFELHKMTSWVEWRTEWYLTGILHNTLF